MAIKVFYSYAPEDEDLQRVLEKHLKVMSRSKEIEDWDVRDISAGAEWRKQVDEHLETADIILLLLSADFLASDYCYEFEMRRALERHLAGEARVIPIILRACDWQKVSIGQPPDAFSLGKLQPLP